MHQTLSIPAVMALKPLTVKELQHYTGQCSKTCAATIREVKEYYRQKGVILTHKYTVLDYIYYSHLDKGVSIQLSL